jgi:hypothetical protein
MSDYNFSYMSLPPGYCNYENIIKEGIGLCPAHNGISVELGVYYGQSSFLFHHYIKSAGKTTHQHFGIDSWEWDASPEELFKPDKVDASYVPLQPKDNIRPYRHVMSKYLLPLGLMETSNFIKADTSRSAGLFEDNSIDFIFIDAAHSYEGVMKDLIAWWPKAKIGSLFAGHDADWTGVRQAVEELFGDRWVLDNTSWKVYKMNEDIMRIP